MSIDFLIPILAATTPDGRWKPGIGDPTFAGWFTVAAYLGTAALSVVAAWTERSEPGRPSELAANPRTGSRLPVSTRPIDRGFWWIVAALLLALGINKQLDLQTALTHLGRDLARAQGWYNVRRPAQRAFIVAIALGGVTGLAAFGWFFRRSVARNYAALAGLVFLLAFVLIRAASFHHIDVFLAGRILGMRWNPILELGGIALIASSAASRVKKSRECPPADRPEDRGHLTYRIPGR